ncbi:hypothetical protein SK069_08930 [Patulibacter brassicae]|uniref:Glycosyltransferase RgtA/B/C/D-like domain-containing protein n=1 Tax=Patulibacter brassicae TaxID=1705717 RepID=A0ABU4VKV1_9ACTN|nr:hypothetical protein [Patulibacter brassicae]MDX8151714.1 hypothetical protein [Patulibacter brassicae]
MHAVADASPPAPPAGRGARLRAWWPAIGVAVLALAALVALGTARARFDGALPWRDGLRTTVAALLVVALPGVPLARRWTPPSLERLWPVLVLPLGLVGGTLALTVLALVGLRPRPATLALVLLTLALLWRDRRRPVAPADWPASLALLAGAAAAGALALLPLAYFGGLAPSGNNPDAHQVIGVVWFLQESHPLAVNAATALDQLPPAWAGRFPIFLPLAAATEAALTGPIQMFTPFVAVLAATLALTAGLAATIALRLPAWAGGVVAVAVGGSAATLYSLLHPYYNQVWGMTLLSAAVAMTWLWLRDDDDRAAQLAVAFTVLGMIAYPTTLPYVALAGAAIAVGARRRPRLPEGARRRLRRWWWVALVVLGLPVLWAIGKIVGVLGQFLDGSQTFWQGDVNTFAPHAAAYGIDRDWLWLPVLVAVVAVGAVWRAVGRRHALAWAGVAVALLAVDQLLRDRPTAAYADYKHVTFTALLLLPLALGGALAALRTRRPAWMALGAVVLVAWAVPAVGAAREQLSRSEVNATGDLQQIGTWSDRLPRGASILVDLPASGFQLWATLFLAANHPLAATDPVSSDTTYSVPPRGQRADFVLGLRRDLASDRPLPAPRWAAGRPVVANRRYAIWRMRLPGREAARIPQRASRTLVLPHPLSAWGTRRQAMGQLTVTPSLVPGGMF